MIHIILRGHQYNYDIEELIKAIIPNREIIFAQQQVFTTQEGLLIISSINELENKIVSTAEVYNDGSHIGRGLVEEIKETNHQLFKRQQKRLIKASIVKALMDGLAIKPQWGILVGVRPVKLVHQYLDQGYDIEQTKAVLKNDYLIQQDKIKLMTDIAQVERKYIRNRDADLISLYVGVPFCPTRCLYCSFTSNPLDKWSHMVEKYVEALRREIEAVVSFAINRGRKIQTIYIGGGTPTTLSAKQLGLVIKDLDSYTSTDLLEEFTLEAGRPDTIDYDKLFIAKTSGITRISINPQTMNDSTLRAIGRNHSSQDIIDTFNLAKKVGFDSINADIILGLPGESKEMLQNTLTGIRQLMPDNLTVHTMAVKRASQLREEYNNYQVPKENIVEQMLEATTQFTKEIGMVPYYMYRQKYMVGNLENVGYSLPGKECIYNIQIIEEAQTILGLGPGAITKVYYPQEDRLERVENVKNLEHYINRIDEMIARKKSELEKLF